MARNPERFVQNNIKLTVLSPRPRRPSRVNGVSFYDTRPSFFLAAMTFFLCLPVQISSVSQDFLMLQQKLNQIIMAHQIDPTSNGMFTRGLFMNGSHGTDQQHSGISLIINTTVF